MIEGGYWLGEHWEWRKGQGFTLLPGFAGHLGMHIWAGYGYSPNSTPDKLIAEFQSVRNDHERLKTFVNTVLGELWTEPGEQVDADALRARAETYPAEVPPGVQILTAGVDVQQDRLEIEVVGWGAGEESWSIDYQVLIGDPTQEDVWAELMDLWQHGRWSGPGDASHRLTAVCVDSGFLPKRAYRFVALAKAEHVYPVKGRSGAYPVIEQKLARDRRRAKRKKAGAAPEMIGVDEGKSMIQRRLRIAKPGPGYCHFPADRDAEWFKQLTGERQVTKYPRGGRPVREWIRTYRAVEALDCRVYAYAALLLSGAVLTAGTADQPTAPRRVQ
jgi:phage terminase large subunit GpA-like protein